MDDQRAVGTADEAARAAGRDDDADQRFLAGIGGGSGRPRSDAPAPPFRRCPPGRDGRPARAGQRRTPPSCPPGARPTAGGSASGTAPLGCAHRPGLLGRAQRQVVVLAAVVAGTDPADPFQQRPPIDHQVAEVHLPAQSLRENSGLRKPPGTAVGVQLILVGIDHVGLGSAATAARTRSTAVGANRSSWSSKPRTRPWPAPAQPRSRDDAGVVGPGGQHDPCSRPELRRRAPRSVPGRRSRRRRAPAASPGRSGRHRTEASMAARKSGGVR